MMKAEIKWQVIFNVKKNHGKSLINTEQMVFDEHKCVFNRNRLHHCVVHTQMMGEHFFFISLTSLMKAEINTK